MHRAYLIETDNEALIVSRCRDQADAKRVFRALRGATAVIRSIRPIKLTVEA